MKKMIFALTVIAVLLVVAMPVAAQGPVVITTDEGRKAIFVRPLGTNMDPFGGLPILSSTGSLGSASKFGFGGPFSNIMPGGKPSDLSGDGADNPRKSIFIGGAWDTVTKVDLAIGAKPKELPACATLTIPAGASRWFKMDTWKNKKLQVWVDDELAGAKAPSGSSVFGGPADAYNWGTQSGSPWQANIQGAVQYPTGGFLEGIAMAIFDPDAMRPNYAYAPPNAALYTGGQKNERSAQGVPLANDGRGVNLKGIVGFDPLEAWATWNKNQPSHLLWYEGHYDGWVHARVYNQMIWDETISVCSYRAD